MTNKSAAKLLGWLLAPLAILGGVFAILSIGSIGAPRRAPVWEGEEFGNTDWFAPLFFPILIVYIVIGFILWIWLMLSAYLPEDALGSKIVWGLHASFNLLATLFWIFVAIHQGVLNPGWHWLGLMPILVTLPVFLFSGRFFLKSQN
jgi:hypothetical protein